MRQYSLSCRAATFGESAGSQPRSFPSETTPPGSGSSCACRTGWRWRPLIGVGQQRSGERRPAAPGRQLPPHLNAPALHERVGAFTTERVEVGGCGHSVGATETAPATFQQWKYRVHNGREQTKTRLCGLKAESKLSALLILTLVTRRLGLPAALRWRSNRCLRRRHPTDSRA